MATAISEGTVGAYTSRRSLDANEGNSMADINLLVESHDRDGWTVVEARGEIDLYTAPKMKEHLTGLVEQDRARIVVDLGGVDFLDSTGLGVLIGSLKRCREREGDLALAAPSETVLKVLRITGLDKVFPIHDTVEEATSA
jgi:anti-sigma B factor antagonist